MLSTLAPSSLEFTGPRSARGTPVWEMAHFFPYQGDWTEQQYFDLHIEHRVEYVEGCLVFLPIFTRTHQLILQSIGFDLDAHVESLREGVVFFTGYPIRTVSKTFRLPDVAFLRKGRPQHEQFAEGADLIIEVMTEDPSGRTRDLTEKRTEYAAAGIPEYWIVDPEQQSITVLTLDGDAYRTHGEFKPGDTATSPLLPGFTINVTACFAAAE
jgi:Uma2 family endonuclease